MASKHSYLNEEDPDIAVKSLFNKYDKKGNGRLEKSELSMLIKNDLGVDDDKAEAAAMLLDKDGSGGVSFQEFFAWFTSENKLLDVKDETRYHLVLRAVGIFKAFDTNDNGTIERDELQHLMKSLAFTDSLDSAFETLDKDKNGKISFPEFIAWLSWLPPST